MPTLMAVWRASLHRTRADWPIVAAAWRVALPGRRPSLCGTDLLVGRLGGRPAPGARRCSRRGMRQYRGLARQWFGRRGRRGRPRAVGAAARHRPGRGQHCPRLARRSLLELPGSPRSKAGDQAIIGFRDGLRDHATLVDGAGPAEGGAPLPDPGGGWRRRREGAGRARWRRADPRCASPRRDPAGHGARGRHLRRRRGRGPLLERRRATRLGDHLQRALPIVRPLLHHRRRSPAACRRCIGAHAVAGLPGLRAAGGGRRRPAQDTSGGAPRAPEDRHR